MWLEKAVRSMSRQKEQIYEDIFRRNYRRLYLYATCILDCWETARDIVGDVFAALWENYDFDSKPNIDSYLFSAVRNRCYDVMRHRRVVEDYEEAVKIDEPCLEDEWIEYEERIQSILKVIHDMPPQMQIVFRMCYLEDKSYKEVAAALGISESGVKKHIVKGLARLRSYFNINYKKGR